MTDTLLYDFPDSAWAGVVNETDTVVIMDLKPLEEEFRRAYQVQNTTPEMRSNMLKQAAMEVRVEQAARDQGLDTLEEFSSLKQRMYRGSAKAYLVSQIYAFDGWEPSDSLIAAYYDDHYDEYNPEHHIQAQQLIVQDLELANFLREQINLGLDLEYLANYYGKEEGYDVKFEDLGVVKEGQIEQDMFLALKNTHATRTTRVVPTKRGYQIGKVFDRNYERPLEMVRSEIRMILGEQHRWDRWEQHRDELFAKHRVTFPGVLPPFELPRLSDRNHERTLPKRAYIGPF